VASFVPARTGATDTTANSALQIHGFNFGINGFSSWTGKRLASSE